MQLHEWSCGAACVGNALRCFGINIDENQIIPIANTVPPSRCKHCRRFKVLEDERTCKKDPRKCACECCKEYRRLLRGRDCIIGTSEKGILAALRHFGADHSITAGEYTSESRNNAWQWLHGTLIHGRVAILCINSWNHWVLAYGTLGGDKVHIFDPYPSKANIRENGSHPLSKSTLMRKWYNARHDVRGEKRLYAISVGRS